MTLHDLPAPHRVAFIPWLRSTRTPPFVDIVSSRCFKVALSGGCPEIMQLADAIQIVDTPDDSSIVYNSTWCSDCPVISMRPFHRSSAFLMPAYFFQPRSTWQLLRGHSVQVSCFRGHAARGRYTDLPAFSMTFVQETSHLTLCLCSDYGARGLYTDYRHVC